MSRQVPLPPQQPGSSRPPQFVLGGAIDTVVDVEALEELAAYCGAQAPVVIEGLAHDVMLDARWREAAGALRAWVDSV